jgi:cardiolipin synthase
MQFLLNLDWGLVAACAHWATCLVMIAVVTPHRTPAAASAWLLFLFMFPYGGLLIYLVFGRLTVSRSRLRQHARYLEWVKALFAERSPSEVSSRLESYLRPIVTLDQHLSSMGILDSNDLEILADSRQLMVRLAADIDAAQSHVHMVYYEIADDKDGLVVLNALVRAAQRGVRCRVLIDAVGARRFLRRILRMLREAGIEAYPALPIRLFGRKASRPDLRNHRKLTVIDGRVGYVGSHNLIEPSYHERGGLIWEDLSVRIAGPVVKELQVTFLGDWYVETDCWLDTPDLFPAVEPAGPASLEILPSGEGYENSNARLFTALIHAAQQRVVIVTPYFVPSEAIYEAMQTAARSQVEVYLIVPRRSNSLPTMLAAQSYYDGLLASGVQIHLYTPYFLHAKTLSVDGQIAVIGSSNMDLRSFHLDAEVSLIVYDPAIVQQLRVEEERYLAQSQPIDLAVWRRRPRWRSIAEGIARLASPLL